MRRDRTGELVDDDEDQALVEHHCDGGWYGRDSDRPRPCPRCKPHLSVPRQRATAPDPDRIRAGVELCRQALAQARTEAQR